MIYLELNFYYLLFKKKCFKNLNECFRVEKLCKDVEEIYL